MLLLVFNQHFFDTTDGKYKIEVLKTSIDAITATNLYNQFP